MILLQAIKSHTSQTARAVFALAAERRWVVTGTPVQNNLQATHLVSALPACTERRHLLMSAATV